MTSRSTILPWLSAGVGVVALTAAGCRTTNPGGSTVKDVPTDNAVATNSDPATGVLEHHNHASRDGLYTDAAFTRAAAAGLHRDAAFDGTFQGNVYAQPLYVANGPGGKALVIVATESDEVLAFDAQTGAKVWNRVLGQPMAHSALPCGNVDPLGITGTPAIDAASRTVVVDAMLKDGGTAHHKIFGLSLDDGSIKSGWPVDVQGLTAGSTTFDSSVQNERGALTILNGTAYVPYGGHWGDCGDYHGWVVGVPVANPSAPQAWTTRAHAGGIWAPGGVASDGQTLFAVTGNTMDTESWADGEAILHLQPGPTFSQQPADYFSPKEWHTLDDDDADLGGTGPTLIHVDGATPSDLVAAFGKNGYGYLADRANLGGVSTGVAAVQVNTGQIITQPAAYTTSQGVFLAVKNYSGRIVGCSGGGNATLAGVKVTAAQPPTLQVAWCANQVGRGAPAVTSTDGQSETVVWIVGSEADNRLRGYNGETGAVVFDGGAQGEAMSRVRRFQTPIVANGRLYVAGDGKLYSFVPGAANAGH